MYLSEQSYKDAKYFNKIRGVNLMKNRLYISVVLAFILIIGVAYYFYKDTIHTPIDIKDVESISILGHTKKIVTDKETENILGWFNSISNIHPNPNFSGTTDNSSIEILLKSNEKISIYYPAKNNQDFEIQRHNKKGKLISYWGNQSNIRKLLEEASK